MAIAINKGKVPKDYTVCVLDVNLDQGYDSSAAKITTDLTVFTNESALSSFPPYYMIAEVFADRNDSVSDLTTSNTTITWDITLDSAIINKYRFIRFVLDPMINYNYNGTSGVAGSFLSFCLSLTVGESTYTRYQNIANNIRPGFNLTLHDIAFLFDTKSGALTVDEEPNIRWSDN